MTAAETSDALGADRIKRRVITVSAAMVTIAAILTFFLALKAFERDLLPEMDAKINAVALRLSGDFDKALGLGIPMTELKGVAPVLEEAIAANPEVAYVAVTDTSHRVLFIAGSGSEQARPLLEGLGDAPAVAMHREVGPFRERRVPLTVGGEPVGGLHVAVPLDFVRDSMRDIALDLGVVLLVSLLATFELLMFFINRTLSGPLSAIARTMRSVAQGDLRNAVAIRSNDEVGQFLRAVDGVIYGLNARFHSLVGRAAALRDAGRETPALRGALERVKSFSFAAEGRPGATRLQILTDVRMPLLLYVLAGEMSRSFFPNFVKELYTPIPGLSYEAVLGLPISAFMFVMAAATPVSGGWADRVGPRRLFLLSIIPTLVGLIGTGLAQSFAQLVAFWCLNAVGYAMATIACQSRIAESTTGENRAQGMAVFVTAIMVAAICGTSFGGVISDRIGFRATFLVSSVLVVISGLIVAAVFVPREGDKQEAHRAGTWQALRRAAANGRFAALLILGAVPAKMILTGFLFYLTPLYLADLGHSQSTIGRSMMVYFAIMIIMSPLFARAADRYGLRLSLVVLGGLVAGAGALMVPFLDSDLGAVIAIVALGLGHALGTAPLIAMVPEICSREVKEMGPTALLGVLRVVERVGSVLGPVVAGLLVSHFGYALAAQAIGAIVAGSALLLLMIFTLSKLMTAKVPVADEAR